ncbi:hypothetical protein [Aldersonia kunmingensis]|uniref:hypothetical protein n=1 Tax=Aldersonia kunmingensis TaxID=408066 RepID=UPI00082E01A0|nr:hypothetical protein [Aldersonia kunmingensis]
MMHRARIGVVTVAATLAGLMGAGAANAVPLSNVAGEGTYAVGSIDSAQMLPGLYSTKGPVDGEFPCEWEIRTSDGRIRTEGKSIESARIAIADGERLDTRNCASWVLDTGPNEATMSMILASLGFAGTGSALVGSSLASIIAASLWTGNGFALETGSSTGSTAALSVASAMALMFGSGSAGGGDDFGTGSGVFGGGGAAATADLGTGSAGSIIGRVIPGTP